MFKAFRSLPPLKIRPSTGTVTYEDGVSLAEFYPPHDKFLGRQVVPPGNKLLDGSKSFMAPVSHIHLLQDEIFYVKEGEGLWYIRGQGPRHLKAGNSITIPQFVPHRFENASESNVLTIEYNYDESMRDMEMRFFYNVFAYMDDCRRAKVPYSILQLCVFLADCWMPIDLGIPGPSWINLALSTLFIFTAAAIGRSIFGYERTYQEYYQEDVIADKKST